MTCVLSGLVWYLARSMAGWYEDGRRQLVDWCLTLVQRHGAVGLSV